jgi:uncharacterized phage protein (TIGR02218 family)
VKSIPVALAAHYALPSTTLATGLRITRTDGQVFAFTSHQRDAVIGGITYQSAPGLRVTDIVIQAGAQVGNLELTTFNDGSVFSVVEVLSGVWKNAAFVIFRYNWESVGGSPEDGVDTLLTGTLGEGELRKNELVIELRDLRQYFQQSVGSASSKTCRYRLGDSRCGIELAGSPNLWTKTITVTGVTSNQVFTDASRTEPSDWFTEGILTWLTGNNAGLSQRVKDYALGSPAAGEFTLAFPMLSAVQVGDTASVHAGCRKRLEEDCRDKFDNVLNFGGEPHRPGIDALTQAVDVDV